MTVRVALIGAGVMGADHAHIVSDDVPGAEVQVVCDVSEASARRVADACGVAHVACDAVEAIGRRDVDAVLIASPDATHAGLTRAAINLEKPVLCEKPLALTPADCLSVIEAERAIGRPLVQVGFMRRFDPSYGEMKSTLRSGQIGRAVMMHNFHRNATAPRGFNGLMAITNSAPHEFDAVRYVLGAEISAISAFEPGLETQGACNPVVLVMETDKGHLVTVEVNNNASYGYDVRAELVGSDGAVALAWHPATQIDRAFLSGASYPEDWRPRFREAYRLQNIAWIKSIERGVPSDIAANAWDGYCAAAIAEAGAEALASGQRTPVRIAERPALYSSAGAVA